MGLFVLQVTENPNSTGLSKREKKGVFYGVTELRG